MATLHNEEDLARKDMRAGDDVIVLRAGDVIPQVVSPAPHVVEHTRPPAAARGRPQRCPFCDTPTVKPEGAVFTNCPNRDLPGTRAGSCSSTSSRAARWTSTGSARSRSALLLERGLVTTARRTSTG